MTGDERIGNAFQSALLQIDIRAANVGEFNFEECRIHFQFGRIDFAQFNRGIWFRDNGDERHRKSVYIFRLGFDKKFAYEDEIKE